jgi:hypothetical protein
MTEHHSTQYTSQKLVEHQGEINPVLQLETSILLNQKWTEPAIRKVEINTTTQEWIFIYYLIQQQNMHSSQAHMKHHD